MCNLKIGGAARLCAAGSKLIGGINYADRTMIDICTVYSGRVNCIIISD